MIYEHVQHAPILLSDDNQIRPRYSEMSPSLIYDPKPGYGTHCQTFISTSRGVQLLTARGITTPAFIFVLAHRVDATLMLDPMTAYAIPPVGREGAYEPIKTAMGYPQCMFAYCANLAAQVGIQFESKLVLMAEFVSPSTRHTDRYRTLTYLSHMFHIKQEKMGELKAWLRMVDHAISNWKG